MIVAPDWIWLHVPKCAGSATERLLRGVCGSNPAVQFDKIDPTGEVIWHQTIAKRQKAQPSFDPGTRRVIANIRRLPEWILSRVHFEVQRAGPAGVVRRAELVQGRFRNNPKADAVKPPKAHFADSMIGQFLPEVTDWVRSENLVAGLAQVIGFDPAAVNTSGGRVNEGRIAYIRDVAFWFTQAEIDRMYAANPLWAGLEQRVYGNLLSLD